jgi:aminoglycoside phosphotransferase (APT) family kinase protein
MAPAVGSAPSEQMRVLAEMLGRERLELFTVGGESRTYRVTGTDHLVTVPLTWPDPSIDPGDLHERAELLGRIARRVSVTVPQVVRVLPEAGFMVVRRLPGVPLIDIPSERRVAAETPVAAAVGTLLGELHTWEAEAFADVASIDEYSPDDWRDETAEVVRALTPVLSTEQREDTRHFLSRPAPRPAAHRVLSHNDLGIEHVLVAESDTRVTGVIDWGDAAITDAAYDFGLLLRDMGPGALETAFATYARRVSPQNDIRERAGFYAACALLEDLAFGHANDRPEYIAKSLAGWGWTFRAATG